MDGRHGGAGVDVVPQRTCQIKGDEGGRVGGVVAGPGEGPVGCWAEGEEVVGAGEVGEAVVGCGWVGDFEGCTAEDGGEGGGGEGGGGCC